MKVVEVEVYLIRIPFRFSFRHAKAVRKTTENLIVVVKLDNGIKGFGEGIPREYVTGETPEDAFEFLKKEVVKALGSLSFERDSFLEGLGKALESFPQASRCAVEIACLDAFSRSFNMPLYRLFGISDSSGDEFQYSGVVSAEGFLKTLIMGLFFRMYGFKEIKVKVGFRNDIIRLSVLRTLAGSATDIRLDANGIWNAGEAIEKIKAMRDYNISMVEQPVAPGDLAGFKTVTEQSGVETMADESLRTPSEAEILARDRVCCSFNIRLSKCGGFLNSLKIARIAENYGLSFQIGCHVGETGILSAAGRHLAACLPKALYLEGSYGRLLLTEDVIDGDISFGRGGLAKRLDNSGLGIDVKEDRLLKYLYKKEILKN